MNIVLTKLRSLSMGLFHGITALVRWYLRRSLVLKIGIAGILIALIGVGSGLFSHTKDATDSETPNGHFVTLATVQELAGAGGQTTSIGTVRATTGADIRAQAGGTVVSVNAKMGDTVPAGFVIATLENASERAALTSAQGAYDAAVAARDAHSLPDTEKTARDTYRSAYTTLDTVLENTLSSFFGDTGVYGPKFLVSSASLEERNQLSGNRQRIDDAVSALRAGQTTASTADPETLLDQAESVTRDVQTFLNTIATITNKTDSTATTDQKTDLTTARTSINTLLTQITGARTGLRSGTVSATAGADATVKQALGGLEAAKANLERTIVRAPVGGQIDFLSLRVGDYVTALEQVASIAQSGTLEVIAYLSEDDRSSLSVGDTITVNEKDSGVVTSLSPALDPVTKQIEVHIAVDSAHDLVNGQSVRIALPHATQTATSTASSTLFLPLTSVKLRTHDRIVFSVTADEKLEAHPVAVGDVHGDRIEIKTPLPPDLRIVVDARGLAEGETVRINESAQ